MWAAGDNTSPVAVLSYRDALEAYVAAGGKLLMEGGELAYDSQSSPGYPTFCANVLHVLDWTHDSSGDLTVSNGSHPITTFPNTIGTITFGYANYGDQDASLPTADAEMVCNWSSYSTDASVIVYDDNPNPQSAQIVFYQFDYLEGGAGIVDLLENTVTYLMTPEGTPDGSISGTITLEGETNHSGITVTVTPGGASIVTDVSGGYVIEDLYDAMYTVQASKDEWSTCVVEEVVVSGGGSVTGVDMTALPCDHRRALQLAVADHSGQHPGRRIRHDHIRRGDGHQRGGGLSRHHAHLHRRSHRRGDVARGDDGPPAQQDRRLFSQHRRVV